jgi:hypothetical protein
MELKNQSVVLQMPALYLKCVFLNQPTVAEEISNSINADFNLYAAQKEALRLGVYDDFLTVRNLCNEIESTIQNRNIYPLLPPISVEVDGDFYLVQSIEYFPHEASGVRIAVLKTVLV